MVVEVQGHRIAGRLAPENSLSACEVASRLGIDSVEFDVRRSKDGVLVVSHGPESPKMPQGMIVEQMTWSELQSSPLPGTEAEYTPTLESVVRACISGRLFMNVEIKPGHSASVPEVLAMLSGLGAAGKFVISSFDRRVLRRVFQVDASVGVGALYNGALDRERRQPTPDDFATWFPPPERDAHPKDSVNLCQETVTRQELVAARAAGKRVMLWFSGKAAKPEWEDSSTRLRELLTLGADCICTNRPDLLQEATGETPASTIRGRKAARL